MPANKTFFSYARSDSNFALKLAKDLREAGINVWIDQLDIPTGLRWDTEIEKALISSDFFLVILTAASVSSDNVLDEISYAIEEGKKVIPLVLNNCNVPMRLKRLQYIDFT